MGLVLRSVFDPVFDPVEEYPVCSGTLFFSYIDNKADWYTYKKFFYIIFICAYHASGVKNNFLLQKNFQCKGRGTSTN